jgi:hypothetical protein
MPNLPLSTDDRPLLPRIPAKRRGPLVNAFLDPIRAGVTDLHEIVSAAVATTRQQIQYYRQWPTPRSTDELQDTILAMLGHPTEALALAAELLAYEVLPHQEKSQLKFERNQRSRQAYMSSVAPTEKQMAYLRRLGVTTVPKNRWEASQLIDAKVGKGADQ